MSNANRRRREAAQELLKLRPDAHFRPKQIDNGRYAIEIHPNEPGRTFGFLHFIESSDGKFCTVSDARFAMKTFYALEEAEGICQWLKEKYDAGEVG